MAIFIYVVWMRMDAICTHCMDAVCVLVYVSRDSAAIWYYVS